VNPAGPASRFEVVVMILGSDAHPKDHGHWLTPPWTTDSPAWQDIDQRLDQNDLARRIRAAVLQLDWTALRRAYFGVGKLAFPPDLMLMVVLYEMHSGRLHPKHWAEDCRLFDPVKWLARGFQPSPSYFYSFRKRLGTHLRSWNQQVLDRAVAEGWTPGDEASIDGTFVAALGSRHRLLKAQTLAQRVEALRAALAADGRAAGAQATNACGNPDGVGTTTAAGEVTATREGSVAPQVEAAAPRRPSWMAKTPAGRRRQLYRYRQAQDRLDKLLAHHARRETHKSQSKRRSTDQVRIAPSEPEAGLGRDKLKTFRPLYNVHRASDLDTPLILDYQVHATTSDAGLFIPTVQALKQTLGHQPQRALVDGIYATAANLAYGADHGITIYAPVDKKPVAATAASQTTPGQKASQIPKEQCRWSATEPTYYCPEGHRLVSSGSRGEKKEQDQEILVYQYRCPPQHCRACPRASQCTSAPHKGRTVTRSHHEDKVEALRQRMQAPEGEALYQKRGQTVEPRIGDLKAHRGLRCFAGFGLALALIQVGLLVLIQNALCLTTPRKPRAELVQSLTQPLEAAPQPPEARPATTPRSHTPRADGPRPRPPNLPS
jgi:transposase